MTISVITACFNSEGSIEETFKSFFSQGYEDKELIVVDGASTDGTLEIIRRYEDRIGSWISEPDEGIYDALNKGISMAGGEIIGFLHSGDRYADRRILEQVAGIFLDGTKDAVYGDLRYVDQEKGGKVIRNWKSGEFRPALLKRGWMPPHPTLYLRKKVYDRYGIFDSGLQIAADYDLMLRILKENIEPAYLPQVMIDMQTGGRSNGTLKDIFRKSSEDLKALRRNGFHFAWWILVQKNLRKLNQFLLKK